MNFNVLLNQTNICNFHDTTKHRSQDISLPVSSEPLSQTTTNNTNHSNIPPVSSFIKNSEAVLYPSSPNHEQSSPPSYLSHHDELFSGPRVLLESKPFENNQMQHLSLPVKSPSSNHSTMTSDYHQTCSANGTNTPITPPSCLQCSKVTSSVQYTHKPLCNIKTEVLENSSGRPQTWSSTVTTSQAYMSNPAGSVNVDNCIPAANNSSKYLSDYSNIVTKQENIYSSNQQLSAFPCNGATSIPIQNHYHPNTHQSFSSRQTSFRPAGQHSVGLPNSTAHLQNPVFLSPHFTQGLHHQDVSLNQTTFFNHRSHPYLNTAFGATHNTNANGSIPYRPRYSRRNNPDLEKKRVHKCDHPGKK